MVGGMNRLALDDAIRERLVAMTTDFKTLWRDQSLPNRERKLLLAYIIEDVTLIKLPARRNDKDPCPLHGRQETLTTLNPKSSAQQVKTQPKVVELVDKLLDDHIYSEIAEILNQKGIRPDDSARPGQADVRFTDLRVAYLVNQYGLRSRYDRLRDRAMLTKTEAADRLGICESTLTRWVQYGLVAKHAYSGQACLYEPPGTNPPVKHSSRWNRLADRAVAFRQNTQNHHLKLKETQYEAK